MNVSAQCILGIKKSTLNFSHEENKRRNISITLNKLIVYPHFNTMYTSCPAIS